MGIKICVLHNTHKIVKRPTENSIVECRNECSAGMLQTPSQTITTGLLNPTGRNIKRMRVAAAASWTTTMVSKQSYIYTYTQIYVTPWVNTCGEEGQWLSPRHLPKPHSTPHSFHPFLPPSQREVDFRRTLPSQIDNKNNQICFK